MSLIFHDVVNKEFRFGWQEWILDYASREDAWRIFRNIYILSQEFEVPEEIWDRMVHHAIARSLIKTIETDIFKWMSKWTSSSISTQFNPMSLVNDTCLTQFILDNLNKNDYGQRAAEMLVSRCSETKFAIRQFGDYVLGVKVDENISKIKTCSICFDTTEYHIPFIFDDHHKSYVIDSKGDKVYYYYHPILKIIPLYNLCFTCMFLKVQLEVGETLDKIPLIYGFCRSTQRYDDKNMICIQGETVKSPFVIHQGRAGYIQIFL